MKSIFKPILFSTPMVESLLKDIKRRTRRIIKSKHESGLFQVSKTKDGQVTGITSIDWDERPKNDCTNDIQPKYNVGDIMWVRETWNHWGVESVPFVYRASDLKSCGHTWKPSIFMPRAACRLFLRVTGVRAERLQDITDIDAILEGIEIGRKGSDIGYRDYLASESRPFYERYPFKDPILSFKSLWISINGPESWDENPWVFVYEFEQAEKPIDFL